MVHISFFFLWFQKQTVGLFAVVFFCFSAYYVYSHYCIAERQSVIYISLLRCGFFE